MTRPAPALAAQDSTGAVRIINYNIRHGFGASGQLDIEAVARAIETQQPDIVALQEVGRGWVSNGSLDVYSWFSRRLGLPFSHFHPASGPQMESGGFQPVPNCACRNAAPTLRRPATHSRFCLFSDRHRAAGAAANGEHPSPSFSLDGAVRAAQISTIVDFLAAHPFERLVITGDLNATPNSLEIQQLYDRGLRDAVSEAGISPGYTFTSIEPYQRLDYILHSPDLTATRVFIPYSLASDHFSIAATIPLAP